MLVKLTPGLNFINILLAQKLPVDAGQTGIQGRAYSVEVESVFKLFIMVKFGIIMLVKLNSAEE